MWRKIYLTDREITYLIRELRFFRPPHNNPYQSMEDRILRKLDKARPLSKRDIKDWYKNHSDEC